MAWSRRHFLAGLGAGAALGGTYSLLGRPGLQSRLLRPPGAGSEDKFNAACIRCGQCIQACPTKTLRLNLSGPTPTVGTPYFDPSHNPCNLCQGLPELACIAACPTGALNPIDDRRQIKIGTAKVDQQTCLAFNRVTCRACWHACPYPNEALDFDQLLRPVVHRDHCVGCGLCSFACPTRPTAIPIVPRGCQTDREKE